MDEALRDKLGRRVYEVKSNLLRKHDFSYYLIYEFLEESEKEMYRCIGAALWGDFVAEHAEAIAEHVTSRSPESDIEDLVQGKDE